MQEEKPSSGGGGGGSGGGGGCCGGNAALDVQVYPNPSADAVELLYQTEEPGDVTIEVRDTQGTLRKYIEKDAVDAGPQQDHVEISDLPTGVYEVQVVTPTGVMHETLVHP